jgi:ribulose 1,5-bisphosphate synthetase/thiazole synthase
MLLQLALASIAACSSHLVSRAVVVNDISTLSAQYDYIIIGGGTSGLTVANRLTEDLLSTYISIHCVVTILELTASPLFHSNCSGY